MEILYFIGLLVAVWLFTTASAPIQWLKEMFNVHCGTKSESLAVLAVMKLVNCSLCLGFWVGLGYYWNGNLIHSLLMACLVSICAEIFTRLAKAYL